MLEHGEAARHHAVGGFRAGLGGKPSSRYLKQPAQALAGYQHEIKAWRSEAMQAAETARIAARKCS